MCGTLLNSQCISCGPLWKSGRKQSVFVAPYQNHGKTFTNNPLLRMVTIVIPSLLSHYYPISIHSAVTIQFQGYILNFINPIRDGFVVESTTARNADFFFVAEVPIVDDEIHLSKAQNTRGLMECVYV